MAKKKFRKISNWLQLSDFLKIAPHVNLDGYYSIEIRKIVKSYQKVSRMCFYSLFAKEKSKI